MRKWRRLIRTLTFLVLLATPFGCSWRKQARNEREARYQSALLSYLEVIKEGMTRKDVEDYLNAHQTAFRQLCCIDERSAFADLVKIGKEHHPWFCEEHNVYVAFQFTAMDPHSPFRADDSDVLKRITIFHHLDGCM